ncbi:glycoside hydrolase superfamily [Obelidium mucronatum]|nr:glycoside hydrolase superfamily [Obelidium mucronatum]
MHSLKSLLILASLAALARANDWYSPYEPEDHDEPAVPPVYAPAYGPAYVPGADKPTYTPQNPYAPYVPPPASYKPTVTLAPTDYVWPAPASLTRPANTTEIPIGKKGFRLLTKGFDRYFIRVCHFNLLGSYNAKTGSKQHPDDKRTATDDAILIKATASNRNITTSTDLVGVDESYSLSVTWDGVVITAVTKVGVCYALQTLSQLITSQGTLIPAIITDAPKFPYRGFMLDTARNFFPVEDIKRVIDGLAANKLNVFHWHLYDSQSFPIAWNRYPTLLKGAFRDAAGLPKIYHEEEVRDIVRYAFHRNVRVIPEFELPGHTAVFGHVSQYYVKSWNKSPWDFRNAMPTNTSTAAKPATLWWGSQYCNQPPCGQLDTKHPEALEFVHDLIDEIGSWFPDPVLHVGHDEVNARTYGLIPDSWDSGFGDELFPIMQNFTPALTAVLAENGKTYAAWDEVLDDTLFNITALVPKDSVITLWQTPAPKIINEAGKKGFKNIVVSPADVWYLDCSPSARWCSSDFERANPNIKYNLPGYSTFTGQWHNWTLMYSYDPLAGVNSTYTQVVKGGFGALWTETIKRHNLDRFIFPRLSVIAERLWSYDKAPTFDSSRTRMRLNRIRTALVNELNIDAADVDYLGNGEGVVFRTEWCDGAGLTHPGQKTREAGFPGEPTTGGDGKPAVGGAYFEVPTDYCKIASLYNTNAFVHNNPAKIAYPY